MVYDPMLDYTVIKLKAGIKALKSIDRHSTYASYAPRIVDSMVADVKRYYDYLAELTETK